MLSTSVSLPSLGGTSKRAPKSLLSTSGVERSLFSGESSAGPGTYGSVQYIENLETKLKKRIVVRAMGHYHLERYEVYSR